ncbi:MAG: CPBP family intramembrane metalloprotease [Actinomycetota bacterium]|nr:CPBP family intramembrane metalloprotease [Actinomycetota bacterium]
MPPSLPPLRAAGDRADIAISDAVAIWLGAWLVGTLLAGAIGGASGADDLASAGPGWLAGAQLAAWTPMVLGIWYIGRKAGSGLLSRDFGMSFSPVDLVGIPLGVLTQLVMVPLAYWPLKSIWHGTFTSEQLEERARTLYQSASGGGVVVLILVVVVGAPLVEELAYRGLLQGAFTRRLNDLLGVLIVAVWFAAIHFEPRELPGLFVVGIVLGLCAQRTGRLGMGVVAHMAFNATGLAVVAMV